MGPRDSCPASFMAWLALREQGIVFDEHVVEASQRGALAGAWRSAPMLVEDDAWVVFDAAAIMEYASDVGGRGLLPIHPLVRARVRSFVGWQCHAAAGLCASASLARAFAGCDAPLPPHEAKQAAWLFALIDSQLLASGGPYLFGALTLADIAFVPALVRILATQPHIAPWKLAASWSARMLDRAPVIEWSAAASRR